MAQADRDDHAERRVGNRPLQAVDGDRRFLVHRHVPSGRSIWPKHDKAKSATGCIAPATSACCCREGDSIVHGRGTMKLRLATMGPVVAAFSLIAGAPLSATVIHFTTQLNGASEVPPTDSKG